MTGQVGTDGTPYITLHIADRNWITIVDTGFNSDFELPLALFQDVVVDYVGPAMVQLAGGRVEEEEFYRVRLPFDGRLVEVEASFVNSDCLLLGTRMMRDYQLVIHFPDRSVELKRIT